MTVKLGYARVSTTGQNTDNQVQRLKDAGCSEVFEETMSGTRNARSPKFRSLFDRVRQLREEGEEVVVVVTKIDRLSRSLKDFIESVMELAELGASFRALDNSLNYEPNDAASKLMLHIFGALAEFERELIVSRTTEGKRAAMERGVKFGAPPKLTAKDVERVKELWATGLYSPKQIGDMVKGVSRSTIHRVLGLYNAAPYIDRDEWARSQKKPAKK
ncbi:recombinase family protein [Microbacterium sp. CIAB417]|uniref:recombinase family protein n=1 Tax=Microbacterium sp. CIAB417 TaxID=2860287 RepID=UPI001FABF8DC|nr:recombinase family protein [Microbacterium sp. CIAB417]